MKNYQKHKNIENIDWGKGGRRKLLATRTRTHRKPVKCGLKPLLLQLHVLTRRGNNLITASSKKSLT